MSITFDIPALDRRRYSFVKRLVFYLALLGALSPGLFGNNHAETPPTLIGVTDGLLREYQIPTEGELREMLNKPRALYSHVSQEKDEQTGTWIDMTMDMAICSREPLEKFRGVLTDYTGYPGVFKRYRKTEVSRDERGTYQHITVGIGIMSFSYTTFYILLSHIPVDNRETFVMTWVHAGDDGTIRNIRGSWHLASVTLDGRPATFIRYTSTSSVMRKFPLQGTIMNLFKEQEHRDMLNQLIKGAARRP